MSVPDANTIRARMARIRSRAQGKAVRLGRETRQFLNWKHYIRLFPWGVVGAAAIVGYLMVPTRRPIVAPVTEPLNSVPAPHPSPSPPQGPGLFSMLTRMAVNAATRTAIAYAGQALGQYLATQQNPPASPQTEESYRDHGINAS